ncbi:hypothetical protein ACN47E_004314 [Coniothyrium glycines]
MLASSPAHIQVDPTLQTTEEVAASWQDVAWSKHPPKRRKPQPNTKSRRISTSQPELSKEKMADAAKSTLGNATGNAPGGRNPVGEVGDSLTKPRPSSDGNASTSDKDKNAGFGLDNDFANKDVKGSLKVHIKLDLEADIRIIARIKGDIAIGLL